jgi:hypothetical protein
MLFSAVGVVTRIGVGERIFSFHLRDQPPTIRKVRWALSAGVKRPGNEGVHSPSSSTGVKN